MILNLFRKKKHRVKSGPGAAYYQLLVRDIIRETHDAISIVFENPDNRIKYKPGQFLSLIFKVDGEEVRRSYSFCTSPFADETLAVTVKRVDLGKVSNYINEKIKPDDIIEAMEPKGNFTLDVDPGASRNIVLFAGGSGITPLYSIGRSVLKMEPGSRVLLVYQNRDEDSIIYKKNLESMLVEYPGFKVIHILSRPKYDWQGLRGRISVKDVNAILTENLPDRNLPAIYFICGPHGMMETVISQLHEMGVPNSDIHKESYVAPSTKAASHKDAPPHTEDVHDHPVKIILNGEEFNITVKPKKAILETALDANINMPFSCQSGLCTACRGKLKSGKVQMDNPDGLTEVEINQGYVLTCISHPLTDDVVIEVG
ncbi:MAG TPA: ferredoxin--NADP reductase [Cyclobacteriaceae bacterium]|nr:ferredoxin--NADP reductase [Cyclobacteriaceae bacterium]